MSDEVILARAVGGLGVGPSGKIEETNPITVERGENLRFGNRGKQRQQFAAEFIHRRKCAIRIALHPRQNGLHNPVDGRHGLAQVVAKRERESCGVAFTGANGIGPHAQQVERHQGDERSNDQKGERKHAGGADPATRQYCPNTRPSWHVGHCLLSPHNTLGHLD